MSNIASRRWTAMFIGQLLGILVRARRAGGRSGFAVQHTQAAGALLSGVHDRDYADADAVLGRGRRHAKQLH